MLLVDLMDASGSFLPRVRDLVGKNPVVLVGTKVMHFPLQCRSYLQGHLLLELSCHNQDAIFQSTLRGL